MEAILTAVSTSFETAVDMVSTVATTVTSTPILLFFCMLPVIGLGVGMFKRLLSVQ